jgi:hypothetical protein
VAAVTEPNTGDITVRLKRDRDRAGRFHSSNSQTVRAISVTPSVENSRALWHITSSSPVPNAGTPHQIRNSSNRPVDFLVISQPQGHGDRVDSKNANLLETSVLLPGFHL